MDRGELKCSTIVKKKRNKDNGDQVLSSHRFENPFCFNSPPRYAGGVKQAKSICFRNA